LTLLGVHRTQYPSDAIALVVLWRLRYKLSLRDLAEMFLIRGFVFTYEAVRDWEAKLTPAAKVRLPWLLSRMPSVSSSTASYADIGIRCLGVGS
jgi:transposase-like protein